MMNRSKKLLIMFLNRNPPQVLRKRKLKNKKRINKKKGLYLLKKRNKLWMRVKMRKLKKSKLKNRKLKVNVVNKRRMIL